MADEKEKKDKELNVEEIGNDDLDGVSGGTCGSCNSCSSCGTCGCCAVQPSLDQT